MTFSIKNHAIVASESLGGVVPVILCRNRFLLPIVRSAVGRFVCQWQDRVSTEMSTTTTAGIIMGAPRIE
jgi:hypothetical protein